MATVGIDISHYQPNEIPGDWLFVVVKLTEGTHVANTSVAAQWAFASRYPNRGFYHYARPHHSSGAAQADFFADQALARGFRPGVDMWQLDVEGMLNEDVSGAEWAAFVPAFMNRALARLGQRGFLYVGQFFHAEALAPYTNTYRWWLPNYGPNDGNVHQLPGGVKPVIHQYSSAGGLDRNVIVDPSRFFTTPPVPIKPKVMADMDLSGKFVSYLRLRQGAWLLSEDGGIFTLEGHFYGAPHGKPYWHGRKGARLRANPNLIARVRHPYVVVASSGETYGKGGF
jgi:hypothetical protein